MNLEVYQKQLSLPKKSETTVVLPIKTDYFPGGSNLGISVIEGTEEVSMKSIYYPPSELPEKIETEDKDDLIEKVFNIISKDDEFSKHLIQAIFHRSMTWNP